MRIIYEQDGWRITEHADEYADIDDLKGDTYNPKVNTAISPEQLAKEECEFEQLVSREGVFGYVLEIWNPKQGHGWEHVDSCWGFVGQYTKGDKTFDHYIVEELKSQMAELTRQRMGI